MKTIYTVLPIYDNIGKQCYQRSKKVAKDQIYAISCWNDQLPAFQWLIDVETYTSITVIELFDLVGNSIDITSLFSSLPAFVPLTGKTYIVHDGAFLTGNMPCGYQYLKITTNTGSTLYSEVFLVNDMADWCEFTFYNNCDFYNILYQTGFQQKFRIKSEAVEPSFPLEQEGTTNGKGLFIRSFARQTKKYTIRMIVPDYMVDVLYRMKLHDTINFTNQFGDVNEVINIDITHEWLNDDRYYAQVELVYDFDETVVISGCCNNII
jgi:hypothetical protein